MNEKPETVYIKNLKTLELPELCITIGNFDGIHLGHQKLIEECTKHNLKSAVMSFSQHTNTIVENKPNYKVLTREWDRTNIISDLGYNINYVINIEIDEKTIKTSKEDFIDFLKKMNVKIIVCGQDFSFGYMGKGRVEDLKKEFEVYVIPNYEYNGIRVSSTITKNMLSCGDVENIKYYLGRNYQIKGLVVDGNKIGRTIGFPTANIDYDNFYIPKNGVYLVKLNNLYYDIEKKEFVSKYGMCNIGYNPSINLSQEIKLEVNIFDFDDDIYDSMREIEFLKYIREEKKFNGKEELINQLNHDKFVCLEYIKKMESE